MFLFHAAEPTLRIKAQSSQNKCLTVLSDSVHWHSPFCPQVFFLPPCPPSSAATRNPCATSRSSPPAAGWVVRLPAGVPEGVCTLRCWRRSPSSLSPASTSSQWSRRPAPAEEAPSRAPTGWSSGPRTAWRLGRSRHGTPRWGVPGWRSGVGLRYEASPGFECGRQRYHCVSTVTEGPAGWSAPARRPQKRTGRVWCENRHSPHPAETSTQRILAAAPKRQQPSPWTLPYSRTAGCHTTHLETTEEDTVKARRQLIREGCHCCHLSSVCSKPHRSSSLLKLAGIVSIGTLTSVSVPILEKHSKPGIHDNVPDP